MSKRARIFVTLIEDRLEKRKEKEKKTNRRSHARSGPVPLSRLVRRNYFHYFMDAIIKRTPRDRLVYPFRSSSNHAFLVIAAGRSINFNLSSFVDRSTENAPAHTFTHSLRETTIDISPNAKQHRDLFQIKSRAG